jgi:hypothetical protein
MCNCKKELTKKLIDQIGYDGQLINYEMLSGRIFSTFEYQIGKRKKTQLILHNYCPICGNEYED